METKDFEPIPITVSLTKFGRSETLYAEVPALLKLKWKLNKGDLARMFMKRNKDGSLDLLYRFKPKGD